MPDNVGSEAADLASDADDAFTQMNNLLDGKRGESEDEGGRSGEGDIDDLIVEDPPKRKEEEGERREKEDEDIPLEDEDEDLDLDDDEDAQNLREADEGQLIKDIEKKYPNVFKEFKGLRVAVARDRAFGQVFATPKEAAESAQLNEDYREFEQEILSGNNAKVLRAIQQTSGEGYQKYVKNFLPSLRELDETSYREITYPVIVEVLSLARSTGEARNDKNLVNSVNHLASLIWPSLKGQLPRIAAPEKVSPELEERARQIEKREQELDARNGREFVGTVKSTCTRLLRKRIEKGLDPNNTLSPFLKNSVVDRTMKEVQELLDEDIQFNRVMERTFGRARRSSYANEFKTRMIGTFIGRASQLVGPIRRRNLLAALGRSSERTPAGERPPMRRDAGEGGSAGGRGQALKAGDIDFEASSDYDILSGRAKLRRPNKG